jgi:hypothetical protein
VIRSTTQGQVRSNKLQHPDILLLTLYLQWKVLVLDDTSKKLLDNVLHPDDILNESITSMPRPEILPLYQGP